MKKLLLIGFLTSLVFACSSEMTQADKEEHYKKAGYTYITKKLDKIDKEVERIEVLKIDSILDMSEQTIYQGEINLKQLEWSRQIDLANEIADIDKRMGIRYKESTNYEFEKADAIAEEIKRMELEIKNKSKKKIGEMVFLYIKIVNDDGSTQKMTIPVAFNDDLTVSAEVMDRFFK